MYPLEEIIGQARRLSLQDQRRLIEVLQESLTEESGTERPALAATSVVDVVEGTFGWIKVSSPTARYIAQSKDLEYDL